MTRKTSFWLKALKLSKDLSFWLNGSASKGIIIVAFGTDNRRGVSLKKRETWEFLGVLYMVAMQHEPTEKEQEQRVSRGMRDKGEWLQFMSEA